MEGESNWSLNLLVSNIVNGKNYSNCRLCLKQIDELYVGINDRINLDRETGHFLLLCDMIVIVLGVHFQDEILGIDAVCTNCVDKIIELHNFISTCNQSNTKLIKAISNINSVLVTDVGQVEDMKLYIDVDDEEAKLVLINDETKKTKRIKRIKKTASFNCSDCNLDLESFIDLKQHNKTYHSNLTCDKCHQQFPGETELQSHISVNHKFQCPECPIQKSSKEALQEHQLRVHSDYVCPDCGKSYKGLDKLKLHEQHHKKAVKKQCPTCGKTYLTHDFYLKHTKLCMEGKLDPHPIRGELKRNYACDKCNKAYSTPGGLRVHLRFAHGNAKPISCPHCNKKFTAPSYLKTHMIKHTGEKNFHCDICNNNFVSKEALLYHTRRHTGEKPYSCKVCNDKFVNASARAEHIKFKHAPPKYDCEICNSKFATSLYLRKHMQRHLDRSSKLYAGRGNIPPNVPGVDNMRIKEEDSYESCDTLALEGVSEFEQDVIVLSQF